MITALVEKKKRSSFYSLFGEWTKRFISCDENEFLIYSIPYPFPNHPSHNIPINEIDFILPEGNDQFTIVTKSRSFTFRTMSVRERDQIVHKIETIKERIEKDKQERIRNAKDELNNYIASFHSESIFNHFKNLSIDIDSD